MAEKVENVGQSPGSTFSGFGSLVGVGVSALDSIFGWSSKRQESAQQRLMDKQQDQWKEQQDLLNQWQLDQWNRENEYNDPTNYYQRLFDAAEKHGINPNLLVQGGTSGNVGTSASGVSTPGSTSVPGVGGVSQQSIGGNMNTVLAGMRQRAEIDNIEAQTRNLEQQTTESESRVDLNRTQRDLIQETQNLIRNQALSEETRRDLLLAEKTLRQLNIDNFNRLTDAQVAEAWARVANIHANTAKTDKESKYIEQTAQANIDAIKSQIALNSALYVVNKALAKKYGTETYGISFDNAVKQGSYKSQIDKIVKETQFYDFNQLKTLFSNPSSLIFALTNGFAYGVIGDAETTAMYQLIQSLYDLADRPK